MDNNYLFFKEKEIFMFNTNNENVNFPTQFCVKSISNEFSVTESREVSWSRNVYGFQLITIPLINTKY